MKQKHGEIPLREHNNPKRRYFKDMWQTWRQVLRRALLPDGDAHNNLTDAPKKTLGDHATWLESTPTKICRC